MAHEALRCEVGQRLERPNQFVSFEIWKDQTAWQAHVAAPAAIAARERIEPLLQSPLEVRVHRGLLAVPSQSVLGGHISYVVTHVDVIPPRADDTVKLLTSMAEMNRKNSANGRLEILQQVNRLNHFSIVEVWPDRKVFEVHVESPAVIQFRNVLEPMLGAPYDQRLYKALD